MVDVSHYQISELLYVWRLNIVNVGGLEHYTFRTKLAALKQLYLYIEEGWDERYPDCIIPEDIEKAIEMYFRGNTKESYVLISEEVLEEPV